MCRCRLKALIQHYFSSCKLGNWPVTGVWHCEKITLSKYETFPRDNENVSETGCLSIIVLSASGDLAKKKTFPALFNLYQQVPGILVIGQAFSMNMFTPYMVWYFCFFERNCVLNY